MNELKSKCRKRICPEDVNQTVGRFGLPFELIHEPTQKGRLRTGQAFVYSSMVVAHLRSNFIYAPVEKREFGFKIDIHIPTYLLLNSLTLFKHSLTPVKHSLNTFK